MNEAKQGLAWSRFVGKGQAKDHVSLVIKSIAIVSIQLFSSILPYWSFTDFLFLNNKNFIENMFSKILTF